MAHFHARRIAFRRPSHAMRRGVCVRCAAAFFALAVLAGCAPRGSMDFRLASLETQVMELEEQNRRQSSDLDARLDRLERYAVAQGVERDRIRAAIDASRSDSALAIKPAGMPADPAEDSVASEEAMAGGTGQSAEDGRKLPVSQPRPKSAGVTPDVGPGPDMPYAEPTKFADLQEAGSQDFQSAESRDKPMGGELPYAYTEAVRLTRSGNTEKGRQMLRSFLMEQPESPLAPNAYYWLGETYYHDKRYAQAILTFKEVTSRFPKDPKAAASMLKIGYSYEMLGDKANARFYLNALIEDYPKSEPARLARAVLDERL